MSRAILEVVEGPGCGQQIEFYDEVVIGREVSGPGRIEGDPRSVAPEQVIVRMTELGLEVECIDPDGRTHVGERGGNSVGTGKRFPAGRFIEPGDYLRTHGRIELRPQNVEIGTYGDKSTAIEVRLLELDWEAAVDPNDLLQPVRFRSGWSARARPGFLHASGASVTLRGSDGVCWAAPSDSIRAIAPPWPARLLQLTGPGDRCIVSFLADRTPTTRRRLRRRWMSVLRGKSSAADLAAERRAQAESAMKSRYGRVQ